MARFMWAPSGWLYSLIRALFPGLAFPGRVVWPWLPWRAHVSKLRAKNSSNTGKAVAKMVNKIIRVTGPLCNLKNERATGQSCNLKNTHQTGTSDVSNLGLEVFSGMLQNWCQLETLRKLKRTYIVPKSGASWKNKLAIRYHSYQVTAAKELFD